jgi:hypothetical protein
MIPPLLFSAEHRAAAVRVVLQQLRQIEEVDGSKLPGQVTGQSL